MSDLLRLLWDISCHKNCDCDTSSQCNSSAFDIQENRAAFIVLKNGHDLAGNNPHGREPRSAAVTAKNTFNLKRCAWGRIPESQGHSGAWFACYVGNIFYAAITSNRFHGSVLWPLKKRS
jgi:hypothetical protein